ncbi:type II toxin-antitoxin system VapC family toxin [Sphingomonas sp. MMS24-JH45]
MVIDASVAVKWFVPEEDSDRAFKIVALHQLCAPSLLRTEVGNAIWKKLRRGEE